MKLHRTYGTNTYATQHQFHVRERVNAEMARKQVEDRPETRDTSYDSRPDVNPEAT